MPRRKTNRRPRMTTMTAYDDFTCPYNPAHGRTYPWSDTHGYCPHNDHPKALHSGLIRLDEYEAIRAKHAPAPPAKAG